jgi:hypothetical protein
MNPDDTPPNRSRPKEAWGHALASRGFTPAKDGWRRAGMSASAEAEWLTLEKAVLPRPAGGTKPDVERRGLWKHVTRGRSQRLIFDIPASLLSREAEPGELPATDVSLPEALVDWALASANDETPQGWLPPDSELVAGWMTPGALTVRAGCLVRQGELLLEPDRWALRFPILPAIPRELPADRRLALDLLAADAQSQLRMVRVGRSELPDGPALVAAVDLTGAPHSEFLFLTGLEGVTQVVAWLVETADFLANATTVLRALEVCRE